METEISTTDQREDELKPGSWMIRRVDRSWGKPIALNTPIGKKETNKYSVFLLESINSLKEQRFSLLPYSTDSYSVKQKNELRRNKLKKQIEVFEGRVNQLIEFILTNDTPGVKEEEKEVVGVRIHPTKNIKEIK